MASVADRGIVATTGDGQDEEGIPNRESNGCSGNTCVGFNRGFPEVRSRSRENF